VGHGRPIHVPCRTFTARGPPWQNTTFTSATAMTAMSATTQNSWISWSLTAQPHPTIKPWCPKLYAPLATVPNPCRHIQSLWRERSGVAEVGDTGFLFLPPSSVEDRLRNLRWVAAWVPGALAGRIGGQRNRNCSSELCLGVAPPCAMNGDLVAVNQGKFTP
jgi:hypothetical protein